MLLWCIMEKQEIDLGWETFCLLGKAKFMKKTTKY